MDYKEVASRLKMAIQAGKADEVKSLMEPFASQKETKYIEDKFMNLFERQKDPINFAIECKREKIAIYLVERGFSLDIIYAEEKAQCDEWCYKDHGPDSCACHYDCCKNAEKHHMEALMYHIDSIKNGKARPGERISEPYIDKHMPHAQDNVKNRPKNYKNTESRFVPEKKEKKVADEARALVEKYTPRYATKKGGTLLHISVDKPSVYIYVLANNDVPVNVQDINGDTALHLAVRQKSLEAVEALVQCSADLTLRNKMGQTPVEEAEGHVKAFLRTFEKWHTPSMIGKSDGRMMVECQAALIRMRSGDTQHLIQPGVVVAVRTADFNKLCRLYKRCWCSVMSKVKEGRTLLDWTQEKAMSMALSDVKHNSRADLKREVDAAKNCLRVLSDYRPTSELIHAVLCEDVELTRQVLWANKNLKVNVRFRDRLGKTLLSHAIETGDFDLVKVLLDHGAHVALIRVRENEKTNVTVPLYQKALRRDLDVNIVKLLQTVLPDNREHEEKDQNGNTPLLRAVEEGIDSRTIHWLIKVRGGHSLMDRNKDGLTARELAEKLGRDNVVKVIDKFIAKEMPDIMLRLFPVAFYSANDLLNIVDESGESLQQKLAKTAEDHKVKTWVDFKQAQNQAVGLFTAAASGDVNKVEELNDASYQDKNGYTAMTRAIVFNQLDVASQLCIKRPALKRMGDNCNRYPLHYAYALPEQQGRPFIRLLLERDASELENRVDKDGRVAAEYKDLRRGKEILQMLYDARTLDAFGKRGAPLGPWPKDAAKSAPEDTFVVE